MRFERSMSHSRQIASCRALVFEGEAKVNLHKIF